MSKPRDLSKLFTSNTNITTDVELISTVNSASAYALSEANDYTDSELSSIDLSATIQTASAAAVTYLVDSAPGTLDTLNELAAALGDDQNFATTVTNSLSGKLSISSASTLYATKTELENIDALPSQTGNDGKYLTTDGASASWGVLVIPQAASATLTRWSKVYSSSATVISGSDDSANILSYTPNVEQLYINGILVDYTNYVATSGSTIILNEGVVVDDVVDIISLDPINVINNGYTQEQVDAKLSNYTRWVKTLSGSATLINGNDDNSLPLNYTLGNEEVYVNGILLKRGTDYDTTSVNAITLTEAALSGDTIEIITFSTINLASVYTQTQSDIKYLTPATASTTYLTQSSASSTYLTPSSASNVYLTQSSASSTYLTQSSASALYDNIEQFMTLAISDESTSITTGINKLTMRSPYAMTLTRIPRASLNTVSSSGNPTVDINLSGTSILGVNKLSIDASEKTSTTAATATTLATTSIPDDSEITFDIDTAGTGAKGLKVILYYKRS
jgi:hypothetical protein